jgi:uncharacterized OB-fold protein
MITKGKVRIAKPCDNCGKRFIPEARFCHLCEKCKAKSRLSKIKKQKENYRKKHNLELKGGLTK